METSNAIKGICSVKKLLIGTAAAAAMFAGNIQASTLATHLTLSIEEYIGLCTSTLTTEKMACTAYIFGVSEGANSANYHDHCIPVDITSERLVNGVIDTLVSMQDVLISADVSPAFSINSILKTDYPCGN